MTADVHAIRYRWSESSLLGTRGMGPVETSLPLGLLARWDGQLRDHVWAASEEPGFTFLTWDGTGALIRKHATAAAEGRPGSHAQVLLAQPLTAANALGLADWDGWAEVAAKPLDWAPLQLAAERGLARLRERAQAIPAGRLAGLLAALLQAPAGGYTVLGDPDPLALSCAFGDLLGEFPAFASDEPDDTRAGLPTAVFLRSAGFTSTGVARRRLRPTQDGDAELSAFAAAAAAAYTTWGLAGISALRRDRPPADLAEARDWSRHAQYAPGILRDLTLLPRQSSAALAKLADAVVLDRIKADAAAATTSALLQALDPAVSRPAMAVLVAEALTRISRGQAADALVDRLATLAPLPADWMAPARHMALAPLARLTQRLLTQPDREAVLQEVSRACSIPALIIWINDHAEDDPRGARALYPTLVQRARRASKEDVRMLIERHALAGPVRQFTGSDERAVPALAALLDALPRRALSAQDLTGLAAHRNPALRAALDSVFGRRKRGRLRWPSFSRRSRHSASPRKAP